MKDKDTGKIEILLKDGMGKAMAQIPIAVSAGRGTGIPALYSGWFFHHMKVGYFAWTNPFSGMGSYMSYARTRSIMFWSKNPHPLLTYSNELEKRGIGCYIQYSLNDYEKEGLERGVPSIAKRIKTFRLLVERLGFGGVVWRPDPLILTDDTDIDKLLIKIEYIRGQLKRYTKKLVFSFTGTALYRKVKLNLLTNGVPCHEWTEEQMVEFCEHFVALNELKDWDYMLATYGEKGGYKRVEPSHCVDNALIIRGACGDKELMKFLKTEVRPIPVSDLFGIVVPLLSDAMVLDSGRYAIRDGNCDKRQRKFCGCIKGKDIGQYNTYVHLCEYCHTNSSKQSAARDYKCHKEDPWSEIITRI